jgi:hypothetical protein
LFELAECHEQAGKLKTAVDQYGAYLKKAQRLPADERAKQRKHIAAAKKRLASLRTRVPLLSIKLPGEPADYVVTLDGKELSSRTVKFAQPVNPGRHRIEVEMPDSSVQRFAVELAEGDSKRVDVAPSSARPAAPEPEAAPAPAEAAPAPAEAEEPEEPEEPEDLAAADESGIPMRTWAFVAGGVGVAGIVVGGITGGLAIDRKSTVDDNCDGPACNHEGLEAAEEGQSLALVSTITFGVGLAGLAAGAVLWLLSPSDEEAAATARWPVQPLVGGTVVGVGGTW